MNSIVDKMVDPSPATQLVLGAASFSRSESPSYFSTKAAFLISIVPTLITCCLLLFRALQQVPYRPKSFRNFVQEEPCGPEHGFEHGSERPTNAKNTRIRSPLLIAFLTLSLIGLITQVVAILLPVRDLTPLPRALTWVCLTPLRARGY